MDIITTVAQMREVRSRIKGTVGLVPTLGALHMGHRALLNRARSECDNVIASIFVNPLQFGTDSEMENYPRQTSEDLEILRDIGTDFVFIPPDKEIYPNGHVARVHAGPMGDILEGVRRPGHFEGVVTVVAKLFILTCPNNAYFGEKDYQQLLIIRHMSTDMLFGINIVSVPTVREKSGIACSSRNALLGEEDRKIAALLFRALSACREAWDAGGRSAPAPELRSIIRSILKSKPLLRIEYISIADADTLEELADEPSQKCLVSIAAHVGSVRLIDSITLEAL